MLQIKVEIQDANGAAQVRAVLEVPEDMTREELISEIGKKYPEIASQRLSVMIDWAEKKPGTQNLLTSGTYVIVKPHSTNVQWVSVQKP